MAEEPEDVLELDEADALPPEDEPEHDEGHTDEDDETVVGFGDDGAAPAPEAESSVIRQLRKANRELARKVSQSERPQKIEVGPKPTLSDCEFDEDRYDAALFAWTEQKAKAERTEKDARKQAETTEREWQQRRDTYEADKAKLNYPGYAEAEEEVFGSLTDQHKALLLLTDKPAALVAALHRDPAKLEQLSNLDPARAAMMIGKLEDKVTVTKKKLPQPDTPVRGNAALSGTSSQRELARLEKEAVRTGVRTELANYKRQLAQKRA